MSLAVHTTCALAVDQPVQKASVRCHTMMLASPAKIKEWLLLHFANLDSG
jgi:hypothetical protein